MSKMIDQEIDKAKLRELKNKYDSGLKWIKEETEKGKPVFGENEPNVIEMRWRELLKNMSELGYVEE